MKHLFGLPNLLTLCNLFCGCVNVLILTGYLQVPNKSLWIVSLMGLSLLFDLFDGMIARALKIQSPIGGELDSLADMVSFGLIPGLMFVELLKSLEPGNYLYLLGFFITLFSALRLAIFNLDTEQSYYFKGLATPANSLFVLGLFWIYHNPSGPLYMKSLFSFWLLLPLCFLLCYLLISKIPLFSLKANGASHKQNAYKYVFILLSLLALVFFQISALVFVIPAYILVSLVFRNRILS
ncbi:MAG: CDP-alcohol phosphatidyltransferase [Flavobacteriaceae bacterium]|nr:MAG: CDP-alcohol phosphatidyltransferase [Flavobacteriaceae bacterium]